MEIFVNPTWDNGETCLATLRHIAKEAGAWAISTATAFQGSDIPNDFPERDQLFTPEEWINVGDAVVIKRNGAIAAGPLSRSRPDNGAGRRERAHTLPSWLHKRRVAPCLDIPRFAGNPLL